MATITFTIPDDQIQRVIDAFCATYDYANYVRLGGTMTQAQFTKARIRDWIVATTRSYEVRQRTAAVDAQVPPVTDPDVT
jgi:hypothetical protein